MPDNSVINPKELRKKVSELEQNYPKPKFSDQGGSAELAQPTPIGIEKSSHQPFNVILPTTNTFINADKAFTEPAVGLGFSTPLPLKDTGAFAIVTSNLNGVLTSVAGIGYVPIHQKMGDFEGNLGASTEVVCIEHGSHAKQAPNPSIGSCRLDVSAYSSVVHVPSGVGGQLITTPEFNGNVVLSAAAIKRF
jgi:hypothetical protein